MTEAVLTEPMTCRVTGCDQPARGRLCPEHWVITRNANLAQNRLLRLFVDIEAQQALVFKRNLTDSLRAVASGLTYAEAGRAVGEALRTFKLHGLAEKWLPPGFDRFRPLPWRLTAEGRACLDRVLSRRDAA